MSIFAIGLTDIKDLATVVAACVGSYVAMIGLSTWKTQLKGQVDHELARRILVTLYKYREAIKGVRHPAMFSTENPEPPESQRSSMSQTQIRFYGIAHAYQNRWNKVQEQRIALDAELLESEAIWGDELRERLMPAVFHLAWELHIAIRNSLTVQNPDESTEQKEAIEKMVRKKRDIMYDSLEKDGDEFTKDLGIAVGKCENYLQPKLGRRERNWPLLFRR